MSAAMSAIAGEILLTAYRIALGHRDEKSVNFARQKLGIICQMRRRLDLLPSRLKRRADR